MDRSLACIAGGSETDLLWGTTHGTGVVGLLGAVSTPLLSVLFEEGSFSARDRSACRKSPSFEGGKVPFCQCRKGLDPSCGEGSGDLLSASSAEGEVWLFESAGSPSGQG